MNGRKNNGHHKKNEGAHKPQRPTEASSPTARCPEPNALRSHFTPRTPAEQSPPAPPPGRYRTQSAPSFTRGSPRHRQRLGMVPSRPQGPWPLSLLSLLPLISCGDLGPKAVGTWVWGAEGTATEVRGKPHRAGNKYERVFGGSASLGWNGEGPGRCGGRQVSAEGWTSQQVASTEPSSGVASYHAGVRLGSAGWLIAPDGRGQHGV